MAKRPADAGAAAPRTVVDRAFEVAAAVLPRAPRDRLAHPFGLGEHEPHRWRVSRDVWDDLCDYAGMNDSEPPPDARLLGEYIGIDSALPPNSMLLEPDAALPLTAPQRGATTTVKSNTD